MYQKAMACAFDVSEPQKLRERHAIILLHGKEVCCVTKKELSKSDEYPHSCWQDLELPRSICPDHDLFDATLTEHIVVANVMFRYAGSTLVRWLSQKIFYLPIKTFLLSFVLNRLVLNIASTSQIG